MKSCVVRIFLDKMLAEPAGLRKIVVMFQMFYFIKKNEREKKICEKSCAKTNETPFIQKRAKVGNGTTTVRNQRNQQKGTQMPRQKGKETNVTLEYV